MALQIDNIDSEIEIVPANRSRSSSDGDRPARPAPTSATGTIRTAVVSALTEELEEYLRSRG